MYAVKLYMNKNIFIVALLVYMIFISNQSYADECWIVDNIQGKAAYAGDQYTFVDDGLPGQIRICFTESGGSVSGSDAEFIKYGTSTLIGTGRNDQGNELVEVYQLDMSTFKLHYVMTRIGTKSVAPFFSDTVRSFVGDAYKLPQ